MDYISCISASLEKSVVDAQMVAQATRPFDRKAEGVKNNKEKNKKQKKIKH